MEQIQLIPYELIAQFTKSVKIVDLNGGVPIINNLAVDEKYKKLFKSFLWTLSNPKAFEPLSDEEIIYNQYYWFVRIVSTYNISGEDAGLFDFDLVVLRYAECDLDWSIIKRVASMAKEQIDP